MNIYDSWLVKQFIAHRGLHDSIHPENSLSAFVNAIEHHYAIEMDVQMTADGVLMVFHDDNLKRMTGLDKDIRESTYEEIKNLRLADSQEKIPTFKEFLQLVDGKTPLLIEIKTHKNIGVTEQKVADDLHAYSGEFAVQSFNPFIVKWFYINAPTFIRGQLSCYYKNSKLPWYEKMLLRRCVFMKNNGSQFLSYDVNSISTNRVVKRRKKHLPVLMWTTRSQKQMEDNKDFYDNIIFENFTPTKL